MSKHRSNISLDEIDTGILDMLQNNARIRLGQMARILSIPTSTVHYRIKRMEDAGVIKGYYAKLDATQLGNDYATMTFIRVKHGPGYFEEVGKKLAQIPGVCSIYFIFGDNDFVVLTFSSDREDYMKRLERMINMPEIERTSTVVIAKIIKEELKINLGTT